jgi:hypothetical protein
VVLAATNGLVEDFDAEVAVTVILEDDGVPGVDGVRAGEKRLQPLWMNIFPSPSNITSVGYRTVALPNTRMRTCWGSSHRRSRRTSGAGAAHALMDGHAKLETEKVDGDGSSDDGDASA